MALTPALLAAMSGRQSGDKPAANLAKLKLLHRAIPSTGEMLPVISFGARALKPPADPTDTTALKEVLQTHAEHGGRVVDTMHGGPQGEAAITKAANELGIQSKFFWTTPLWVTTPTLPGHDGPPPKADPAAIRTQFEAKLKAFNVPTIDAAMLLAHTDLTTHLAVVRELKKEGKLRYVGVSDLLPPPGMKAPPGMPDVFARFESMMRELPIDFIGVDYSIGDRRIEEKILPLALEKKIGVMAYFPFDRSRIFKRASETRLPEWAAEFDATTWAQFFLKYVVSHPAVTVVRTGTTKAGHMLDNLHGGAGRLPDEAMRRRMAELVDVLPPTPQPKPQVVTMPPPGAQGGPPGKAPPAQAASIVLSAEVLDRYAGDWKDPAAGTPVTIRRDGTKLLIKSGTAPEGPLVARSETRFTAPWGAPIEFHVDAQGKATGATVEHGPFRIPLERQ
ncbi:MAG TPA: aldo/keto reductase [Phycisphaerales bacterium]|nr:aldo/keto reductase [Phycisphaerales bacterium]